MHTGHIQKMTKEFMEEHLKARLDAVRIPEDDPLYEEKTKYETQRAQEGYAATCSCGWTANNPIPTEQDANTALEEHYEHVNAALERVG